MHSAFSSRRRSVPQKQGIRVQGTDWAGSQRTPEGAREVDRMGKKP